MLGQFLGEPRGIGYIKSSDFSGKFLETPVAVRNRSWSDVFSEDMNGEYTCTVIVSGVTQYAGV